LNSGGTAGENPPSAPLANRVCASVAVGFAIWTVCTHAIVAGGGNLHQLLAAFAFAGASAVGGWLWFSRSGRTPCVELATAAAHPRSRRLWTLQFAALAVALGLAATAVDTPPGMTRLWWGGIATLGFCSVFFLLAEAPVASDPVRGRGPELALWCLAFACAVVALCVHRPDLDDAFYVNVAVAAADFPDMPLLARDTMLGVADLPLHMPAHRIHTYELWNGALSYVTGIPAVFAFHWVSAAGFAMLLALAHAKLFRLLTPRVWPWTVAALILVLLGVGETHRWFGNFSLVRMWQGKAVYLFVFMPLVYAYAIEFALRPTLPRWILLGAAQTAAVGCSSSALWAGPVGGLIAMSCVLRPTAVGLQRLAIGALASAYVLGVGLALKADVQPLLAPMLETYATGAQLAGAFRRALGSGQLYTVGVATILAAWACCPRGLAQRFALAVAFAVLLILLNPYLDHWVGANLTGPSYWRSVWALPVPLLMALVLVAPLHFAGHARRRRVAAGVACAALCIAFLAWVPRWSALSSRNAGAGGVGIWIGRPAVKAPPNLYRLAQALDSAVPAGSTVVAPSDVSVWLPTFPHHAHPLQARKLYLEHHRARLGDDDVNLRLFMTQYAGGAEAASHQHARFASGLRRFDVKGVLLRTSGQVAEARKTLERSGFERTFRGLAYEIWVRPEPAAAREPDVESAR